MDSLFHLLEKESNEKVVFEKKVFDVVLGQGAFFQVPNYVKKIIRKEHILLNGKPKVIRRVFCKSEEFMAYQNVGWVLYTDVQHCMLCQKSFPRFIGRHLGRKKHCHICGNIVCVDCLNPSAVRISEYTPIPARGENSSGSGAMQGYVDACASCYWGQEEISISTTVVSHSEVQVGMLDDVHAHGQDKEEIMEPNSLDLKTFGDRDLMSCEPDLKQEEEEEYDIEIIVPSGTDCHNYNATKNSDNGEERNDVDSRDVRVSMSDDSDSDTCSFDRDSERQGGTTNSDTIEDYCEGEDVVPVIESEIEEPITDANRVNLMMLLTTLSIVHDHSPNNSDDNAVEDDDGNNDNDNYSDNDNNDDYSDNDNNDDYDNNDGDDDNNYNIVHECTDQNEPTDNTAVDISNWESFL